MITNIQQINEHISNFMVKMKLLGVFIGFYVLSFSCGLGHFSTFFKKQHENFRNAFLIKTSFFDHCRNVILKIAEGWIVFKNQITFIHCCRDFKSLSNFLMRACKILASSSVKFGVSKFEKLCLSSAIFSFDMSEIPRVPATAFLQSSCASSEISLKKIFITSATTT